MSVRPPSTSVPVLSRNGAMAPEWRRWAEDLDKRAEAARIALRGVSRVGNRPVRNVGLIHTMFAEDVGAAAVKLIDGAATWTVPADLFEPGTELCVVNMSASGDITLTGGATLRLSPGTSTGPYAVPPGGIAFVCFVDSSTALVYGVSAGTSGGVSSVGITMPTGFSVSGSPVTSSGTFNVTYASGYTGYTTTEQSKLAGIATGATANDTDANLKARANHTGTQAASTISDFDASSRAQTEAALIAGANVTITPAGSGATRTLTIAASGGGADPWTYIKLSSDFVTGSATAVNVTGLAFTPAANKSYEFEACLLMRTATTTVGPRPGLAWASGMTDGVADIEMPTSGTAAVRVFGNINAALLAAVGGLPNTTRSYPARIRGTVAAGATPSGDISVQLASETASTNVTAKAGSYLKFREI